MNWSLSWRGNRDGFSFLEMLFALAIISMLGLSLVSLQQKLFISAMSAATESSREQFLGAVQSRLLLNLPTSSKVSISFGNSHDNFTLEIEQERSEGTRLKRYYKSPISNDFYEYAEWKTWKGSGNKPGSYTTPIASEITYFFAEIVTVEQGKLAKVYFASLDRKRELTIWLRNIRN